VILVGSSLTVMSGAAIAPAMPAITDAFSHAPAAELLTRLVLTTPALFIALFAPLGGLLVDRVGREPVLFASLALYGASGAVGLFTDSLVALLLSRAALGVAVGGLMTTLTTLVGDCYDGQRRNAVLGRQAGAAGLGGMVFLLLGGVLAEWSWRGPFTLYLGAWLLIPVVLALFAGPRGGPPPAQMADRVEDAEALRRLPLTAVAPGRGVPGLNRTLLGLYLCMLLGMGLFYIGPLQVPYLLVERGWPGGAIAGAALSTNTLFAAAVSFNYRRLSRYGSERTRLGLVFVALGGGLLLIGLGSGLPSIVCGMAVAGAALGLLIPTVNQWLLLIAPESVRGRVMGGSTAALFLGQFLSPLIAQPAVLLSSLSGGFIIVGGLALLVALALLWLSWLNQRRAHAA